MNKLHTEKEFTEAINDYSEFSPKQKIILNLLLKISINNIAKATIKYIHEETKITKATISSTLLFLSKKGFIVMKEQKGNRFTGCEIVTSKLHEILMHYQIKKQL